MPRVARVVPVVLLAFTVHCGDDTSASSSDSGAPPSTTSTEVDAASLDDAPDGAPASSSHRDASPDAAREAGAGPDAAAGAFVHPGVLVSGAQLDAVKAHLAAKAEPWTSALAAASSSRFASLSYVPAPLATVECGPFSNPDIGCSAEKDDASAAYTDALLGYLTGDAAHTKKAESILDAWSAVLKSHTNSNAPLQSAWVGAVIPRAGEIVRALDPAWPNAARFATMLRDVYLPEVVNGAAKENGNWELSMAEATIAIAVFLDDRATFEHAIAMWRARVPAYVYVTSDGATPVPPPGVPNESAAALVTYWYGQSAMMQGLCQETCRDLGHVQFGLAAMINAAETARIQGVDLFQEQGTRIAAALEFHAAFLDGDTVPKTLCSGALNAVTPDPMWEVGFNALANRMHLALPRTQALVVKIRPTGVDHHMDWETLTHAGAP